MGVRRTSCDGDAYKDRGVLTWSYNDGEVSFNVGTEHRGKGTAAKPDDQCTDIDEDKQECQDAVRTTLTLEQQDGCQLSRREE